MNQLLYHESADIVIRSDLNVISRPANESSDQGLSNQRGIAKIHRVTAEHEPLEVEVEIPWIPSRTGGSVISKLITKILSFWRDDELIAR